MENETVFSVAVLLAAFATPSLAAESVNCGVVGGAYQDSVARHFLTPS